MPKAACPVCRRVGCIDPTHKPVPYKRDWRKARARRPMTNREIEHCRRAVAEWVDANGYWCPGWGCEGHYSEDLTADHVIPVSLGGDPLGVVTVLCRACNARRGNGVAGPVPTMR